ncbi:chloramphenicol resistance leader peptide [Glutamicibacter sp. NPDC087583]
MSGVTGVLAVVTRRTIS